MEITEIRIFPKEGQDKKLKGYATVTFDHCFVVRNVKIIQGLNGFFVAMPSRKTKIPCVKCHFKNEVGSKFCNQCAAVLPSPTQQHRHADEDEHSDSKAEHRDIAHPITQQFREYLQKAILDAYSKEIKVEIKAN